MRYELLPSPPDRPRIRAYGATRNELFENAGYGMYAIGYAVGEMPSPYSRPVVVPGDTYGELMTSWLTELLLVGETEGLVWSYFTVDRLEPGGLQGSAGGLPVSEVLPTSPPVVAVAADEASLVAVPEGWWVDLSFITLSGLRPV